MAIFNDTSIGKTENTAVNTQENPNETTTSSENDSGVGLLNDNSYIQHIVKVYIDDSGKYMTSLFGHPMYYLQNGARTASDNSVDIYKSECAKCLLYLHSIPYDHARIKTFFTKSSKHGGIDYIPYGYMLLIGGLIWRKRMIESDENHKDPIVYGYRKSDNTLVTLYNRPLTDGGKPSYKPLFHRIGNKYYFTITNNGQNSYNVPYSDFVSSDIDYYTENLLIKYFEDFVSNDWCNISRLCEIHKDETNPYMTYNDMVYLIDHGKKCVKYGNDNENFKAFISVLYNKGGNSKFVVSDRKVGIHDFARNYVIGFPGKKYLTLYMRENSPYQGFFNQLYTRMTVITTTGVNSKTKTGGTSIPSSFVETYITEFCNGLMKSVEIGSSLRTTSMMLTSSSIGVEDRDHKVELYMYIKTLWDRWLCGYYNADVEERPDGTKWEPKKEFDVNVYFRNFVFVDSFYRNIFKILKLNCEVLLDLYNGYNEGKNIYAYLGDIASKHNCMFLSLPDYINLGDSDTSIAVKNMEKMFTPMPANRVELPKEQNRFIVMYTHEPSSYSTDDSSEYSDDTLDIWSESDGNKVQPSTFFHSCEGDGDRENKESYDYYLGQINRYGYNVPSFGITYSRQVNSIFKSINVSMSNPVMTEQAILNMGYIAETGNSSKKKVCFYGQDLYPVYSNYSYTVEVEMMGDAQIQPLMYFQLTNIPIFRGTYLIFSVSHSMRQGEMVTKFKGTKMSKHSTTFTTNWFTLPPNEDTVGGVGGGYGALGVLTDIYNNIIEITDCTLAGAISGWLGVPYHLGGTTKTNVDCSGLVYNIYKEAYGLNIGRNCAAQAKSAGIKLTAQHDDISAGPDRGINVQVNISRDNMDDITKARVGDVLFAYNPGNNNPSHVLLYLGTFGGKPYVCHASSKKNSVICCPLSDTAVGSKDDSKMQTIKYIGRWSGKNYNASLCTETIINAYDIVLKGTGKGNYSITAEQQESNCIKIMERFMNGFTVNGNVIKLTKYMAAAICGNWYTESRWNPMQYEIGTSTTKGWVGRDKGYGLAQWTFSRRRDSVARFLLEKGTPEQKEFAKNHREEVDLPKYTPNNDDGLEFQLRFAEWEFANGYKKLWGTDPNATEGNLLAYADLVDNGGYDENKTAIDQMVVKFANVYESSLFTTASQSYQSRISGAKLALQIYDNHISKTNEAKEMSEQQIFEADPLVLNEMLWRLIKSQSEYLNKFEILNPSDASAKLKILSFNVCFKDGTKIKVSLKPDGTSTLSCPTWCRGSEFDKMYFNVLKYTLLNSNKNISEWYNRYISNSKTKVFEKIFKLCKNNGNKYIKNAMKVSGRYEFPNLGTQFKKNDNGLYVYQKK